MTKKKLTSLGYCNGWEETPKIVERCMAKKHILHSEKTGRCEEKSTCSVCGYFYYTDSSD